MRAPKENTSPKTPVRWYLKEWRQHRGLTQMQLAEKIGTSPGVVSDHETQGRRFNDDWIGRWAYALELEPYQLLMSPDVISPDHEPRDAEGDRLLRKMASIGKLGDVMNYMRFFEAGGGNVGAPDPSPQAKDDAKSRKPR